MPESLRSTPLQAHFSELPRFEWRGRELELESRKPRAMLAFLCLQDAACERERLAELFWGPERLLNVRQALYQLRQLPGADEWLTVGELVRVDARSNVRRFEEAVRAERYGEALESWQPPLLSDLNVPKAPAFREWLEVERSRLEGEYLRVLDHRAAELEREGSFERALELVERFLELDPLRESAYRSAMRLSYLLGNAEAATDFYRTCLSTLRTELSIEPLPATVELADKIGSGEAISVAASPGHLPTNLLRLLQAVVVGRGELGPAELARALETDAFEVAEGLVELERRRLVTGNGHLSRATTEEALATIAEPVRRLLHARIAAALEAGEVDGREESVGEHWLAAHRPESAAPWLLRALERALEADEHERVMGLAFQVLWSGTVRQRFEAALLLEGHCERQGNGELQDSLLGEARRLAWELQEDCALARLDLRRARRLLRSGESDEALSLATEAHGIARRLDDRVLLAQCANTLGVVHFMAGRLGEAQRYFEKNLASSVDAERYRALNNLGALAGLRGDLRRSYRYLEDALTVARELNRVSDVGACLNNLAATAERMADYESAGRRLREGRDLARRTGSQRNSAQILINLAHVYLRKGELGPAWNTAQEALTEGASLEDRRIVGHALEQLGQVARCAGNPGEAASRFEGALAEFDEVGDERKLVSSRCNLLLSRLQGDPVTHPGELTRLLDELHESGQSDIARWFRAELALTTMDTARAREAAELTVRGSENRHLILINLIAHLRADLLDDPATARPPKDLTPLLMELEVLEQPLGNQLLALCSAGAEARHYQRRADELFAEQGQGLPRMLRESLAQQVDRWRQVPTF